MGWCAAPTDGDVGMRKGPGRCRGLSAVQAMIVGMVSGGARTQNGAVPRSDALNRNRDGKDWTKLPKQCSLPVPDWPDELAEPSVTEMGMWQRLWAMPQAHVWHADRSRDAVALYVRTYCEAGVKHAPTPTRQLAKQLAEQLLMSIPALFAGRYVITDSEEDENLQAALRSVPMAGSTAQPRRINAARSASSARNRLRVTEIEPDDTEPEPSNED